MSKAEAGRHDLPPRLDRAEQLRALDGQRVRLFGSYLSVPSLKRMPRPGRPPEYVDLGEVVIQIEGSAAAYDPAAGDTPARIGLGNAARPSEEIARCFDLSHALRHAGTIVARPSPLGGLWIRVTLPVDA